MNFESYLGAIPLLHSWDGGLSWNSGGFEVNHLREIYEFGCKNLPFGPCIIETGAGNSTICFLHLRPSMLVTIAPDSDLFDRILTYCVEANIDVSALDAHVDCSEWALPALALPTRTSGPEFDFALIDGSHNWPMVMLDFFYVNFLVKKGGFIMVDDVQLHSVKELARLLVWDTKNFALRADLGKSLIFEKLTAQRTLPEWNGQPYVNTLSERYMETGRPFALDLAPDISR